MKKTIYLALALGLALPALNSCRDESLEPTLQQSKDLESSINTLEDLTAVLNAGYNRMSGVAYYGRDYIIFGEVRSDNTYSNANSNRFVTPAAMKMTVNDAYAADTWAQIYAAIGTANVVINKDTKALTGGTVEEINQIKGEALIMRALAHFDLLKLYGQQHVGTGGMSALGVPYVTKFRDQESLLPARNTVQEVYNFALKDLNDALGLMSAGANRDAHYFSTHAANALIARMALYFKDYKTAEAAAKKVIDSGKYAVATAATFPATFNTDYTNNQIFSVAASPTDNLGINGLANIYQKGSYGDVVATQNLYDQFADGDVRKTMIKIEDGLYRNVGKYPSRDPYKDDIPVIRYEEVVLIYAEALLQNGNAAEALIQLNKIATNRGAAPYTVANLDNILLERRKELAFEGFRFYDLARTGRDIPFVDLKQTFGTSNVKYGSYNYAFPIPATEIGANSNVVQNDGYK
ncbi:RagB/SusD family nutrient uptake outer membrane protein [Chryseobacterium taklimakanense]|uniref:RagB/SusD family nutrient uptake outer membrane protein n=1 Tax=Chryseobacterium taklimakanense TaxID=536441 RepID=UPI000F5DECCF|nr:RagB/SusD family nutrient uptake outer membrane protein [Chryseobacterium taklimakanense]AZI21940.1 RagB/SusD family nutrient uptake outer membrane protein [Chryseobacterium taklimakanense]